MPAQTPTTVLGLLAPEVAARLPRSVTSDELERLGILLQDAEDLIADELAAAGRDLAEDVLSRPGFEGTARRVAREVVTVPILMGENAGQRSASSTTGAQSDSVTWSDPGAAKWGLLALTEEQRERLGLIPGNRPLGRFPRSRIRRWVR